MQILFFKLNHFSKSFIKLILHNHLFNFEDTFQNLQFIFFSFQKKKRATLQHIFFQLCTCSRMCSLYTFIFSFVHTPECAYCTPILYICHVIQFCPYFMLAKDGSYHVNLLSLFTLAKDGVKCNCIYCINVFTCYWFFFL